MNKKTKGYIYTRVSTAIQVDSYSLDHQRFGHTLGDGDRLPVSVGKYYTAIESMLIPFQSIPGDADMQEEAEKAIVFLWSIMLDCRHKILYN